MSRAPLVIDFETKKSFRDTPHHHELGISVAGAYDYATKKLQAFEEKELPELFKLMENASIIVGYNLDGFDLPVIQPYYPGDVAQLKTFDILTYIKEKIGRRIRLDDVVKATLNEGKTGHGLEAIVMFREGRIDELKKYCLDDVRLTAELFDYGVENNKIYYQDMAEKREIHVSWGTYMNYKSDSDNVSLTLPF